MKIKITHPTLNYQAGLVYDVPDKEAQELIKKDYAFEIVEPKYDKHKTPKAEVLDGNG